MAVKNRKGRPPIPRCQRTGCGHKLTEHGRNGAECERFNCPAGCRLFVRFKDDTKERLIEQLRQQFSIYAHDFVGDVSDRIIAELKGE